jgi:hypothetical protein
MVRTVVYRRPRDEAPLGNDDYDKYIDKIVKYLPAEVVAAYVAAIRC